MAGGASSSMACPAQCSPQWLPGDTGCDRSVSSLSGTTDSALRPQSASPFHICFCQPPSRSDSKNRNHLLRSPLYPCLEHPYPRGHGRALASLATRRNAPTAALRLLSRSVPTLSARCTAVRATQVDAAASRPSIPRTTGPPRAGEARRGRRSKSTTTLTIGPRTGRLRPSRRWR